jgi:hypothetical protein
MDYEKILETGTDVCNIPGLCAIGNTCNKCGTENKSRTCLREENESAHHGHRLIVIS